MDASRHIAIQARRRIRRCRALAERNASNPRRKAVHELRTESRRLLADLELIARLVPPAALDDGRRALKKLLRATADLRDLHVQLRLVKPMIKAQPALKPFRRYLRDRKKHCLASTARKLARGRLRRKVGQLERAIATANRSKALLDADALRAILRHAHARCVDLRRKSPGSAGLHRLRIALKNYCYLAEALCPHLPEMASAPIERHNALRASMGRAHDLLQLEKAVRKFAEGSGARVTPLLSKLARRRQGLDRASRATAARLLEPAGD